MPETESDDVAGGKQAFSLDAPSASTRPEPVERPSSEGEESPKTDALDEAPSEETSADILSQIAQGVKRAQEEVDDEDWGADHEDEAEPEASWRTMEPTAGEDLHPSSDELSLEEDVAQTMRRLREGTHVYGSAGVPVVRETRSSWVAWGYAAWALFILALMAGFITLQKPLSRAWPPITKFYDMVGMGGSPSISVADGSAEALETMNPAMLLPVDEALSVRIDTDPIWEAQGDGWTLVVGGAIANSTGEDYPLSPLELVLVDAAGNSLKRAGVALDMPVLTARETVRFSVRIENAPAQTTGIVHEWKNRSES
ncbi:hypothetical protein GCM10007972_14530 [Iodidimonas muriae]|uniref:DUF3426 domain-containing protein n=1 Tax=Iodidimonas muriae TaxID=261467 RepID=A0ABQ2LCY7_9PROT|nr:hypothetical protein [Iodidimonas muriae]GER07298.1 hypothetical protein JCM17843_16080 [Kordiimonadales bacterium JCM 17843]GGO11061.1 hypothetical protein GCM10007972_14530 [Iodidimonas muriae]